MRTEIEIVILIDSTGGEESSKNEHFIYICTCILTQTPANIIEQILSDRYVIKLNTNKTSGKNHDRATKCIVVVLRAFQPTKKTFIPERLSMNPIIIKCRALSPIKFQRNNKVQSI